MKSRLSGVISELDRLNAPVKLMLTDDDKLTTGAQVLWIGHGEDLLVGRVEATGYREPYSFRLWTDRLAYTFRRTSTRHRCIKYKRHISCAAGIMKHAIPLKPEEQRELDTTGLRLNVETAKEALHDPMGRCCRLIATNAEHVIDYLLYQRESKQLKKVLDELRAAEANYQNAREEYERSLHDPLRQATH